MENIKMTECGEVKLKDICKKIYSGGTPKSSETVYYGGNIPWLNTKEVHFNRIYRTEQNISELGFKNSSAKFVPENNVIVAMYGATAGNVAVNKIPLTTNQACCNLIINDSIASYEYVYYSLLINHSNLASLANGGAQQNLNSKQIREFAIPLPPLDVQKRIAGILGALDDRIDVLRRENVVLEQMAQAVFQSWFVDFDIVRAKAAGTPESEVCEKYHITPELYALFPSALTPDNLPLGWEKKAVKDVLTLNYGKALKETDRISGNIPVYGANGQIGTHNKSLVSGPGIVVGRKGTVGTVIWTDYDFYPIDTSFYVTSLFQEQSLHFLHQMLCSINLPSLSGDSAVPGLNREAAYNQIFICPQEEILKNFENAVTIFYQKRKTNTEQIRALSATRDALLPKLMNGEIEV